MLQAALSLETLACSTDFRTSSFYNGVQVFFELLLLIPSFDMLLLA